MEGQGRQGGSASAGGGSSALGRTWAARTREAGGSWGRMPSQQRHGAPAEQHVLPGGRVCQLSLAQLVTTENRSSIGSALP